MSSHLYSPAYATRLGNLTAKSVLVRICDQANDDDGISWPSAARISADTEINAQTVARIIKVFATMGLVKLFRMEISDKYGRREVDAIQVNLVRLGTDMTEEFAQAYAAAQGKAAVRTNSGRWRLRDAAAEISETRNPISETKPDISETRNPISEIKPPHPLIGRTVTDPVVDPPPNSRACEAEFDRPQQEHLDRLAAEGKPVEVWQLHYREENRKAREVHAAEAAKERELRALYPDLETALAKMRKRCGFAWAAGDELGPILRQVIADQQEMGKPFWRTVAQMVSAWELQRRQGPRLRARYGPVKFYRDGHWLDSDGWHWNTELLAMERGASVGRHE